MRLNLENIPAPYMIHLHKQAEEVIYSDLLKDTLKVSRLQSTKSKIKNQLRQEKVENKAHQQQIKKLKGDWLVIDSQADKWAATQNFLNKKENTIQLLNKKLKIPSTKLIQATELTKMEKEKGTLTS